MKKKLRSQTGASLIFALFLFLICAVVGSVVLTAGTAAAGRLSEMGTMDQRYYAVTSAANLLREELTKVDDTGNPLVVVEIVRTKTVTQPYTINEEGNLVAGTATTSYSVTPSSMDDLSFLSLQTMRFLFGTSIPTEGTEIWAASFYDGPFTQIEENYAFVFPDYELRVDPDDPTSMSQLDVNIVSKLESDGTLTLTVSNADTANGTYTVKLTLIPSVSETTGTTTESPTPDGSAYKATTTETKTAKVTWKLQGIG